MILRLLHSKNFLACLLAAATTLVLYMRMPFPDDNFFFELMFLFAKPVFNGFKYTYIISLYTTPHVCYSVLLSALNIFALNMPQRIRPGLPRYPHPRKRPSVALVIGEIHNPANLDRQGTRIGSLFTSKECCHFRGDRQRQNQLLHCIHFCWRDNSIRKGLGLRRTSCEDVEQEVGTDSGLFPQNIGVGI